MSALPNWQYVSPDHTVFIPAGDDFASGQLYYGTKMANILRAFSLAEALPGRPVYVTDESDEKTWRVTLTPTGAIDKIDLFAEVGGQNVTEDGEGNVYIAAGQILVYDPAGKVKGRIDVPERPIDLVFGGPDRRTLYVLTHESLFAVQTRVAGPQP